MLEIKFEEGEYRVYYDSIVRGSFIPESSEDWVSKYPICPLYQLFPSIEIEVFGVDAEGNPLDTFSTTEKDALVSEFETMCGLSWGS